MDLGKRCKSDISVSYPYALRPKLCVMASRFHDSSPPSPHCDWTCSRYLERSCCRCPYCTPIISWLRASGLRLWFLWGHFHNAWRLSLFRCQTPRKNKQWTRQPRSTTTNLSAVIHL